MTMAPGRKKRGYLLEILLISILLFLLMSSLSQNNRTSRARTDFHPLQRSLAIQPVSMK